MPHECEAQVDKCNISLESLISFQIFLDDTEDFDDSDYLDEGEYEAEEADQ